MLSPREYCNITGLPLLDTVKIFGPAHPGPDDSHINLHKPQSPGKQRHENYQRETAVGD